GDLALPYRFTGCLVDGEHPAVERNGDHFVFPKRNAAVVHATAGNIAGPGAVSAGVHLPLDGALLAGGEVDGIDRAPAVPHIHDAVCDEGGRFQVTRGIAPAALETAQRYRERRLEVLDGIGVDVLEEREAMALIVAMVQKPVLRLLLRI